MDPSEDTRIQKNKMHKIINSQNMLDYLWVLRFDLRILSKQGLILNYRDKLKVIFLYLQLTIKFEIIL